MLILATKATIFLLMVTTRLDEMFYDPILEQMEPLCVLVDDQQHCAGSTEKDQEAKNAGTGCKVGRHGRMTLHDTTRRRPDMCVTDTVAAGVVG